jgi:ABC-type multidrug transport system ATPase subunit
MPLLEVEDLQVDYGPIRALDGVSLAVEEGGIVAVIGPNGAGKTTLLGLLAGTLKPDRGEILLRGEARDPADVRWRSEIGVLYHRTFLYGPLTARENLRFYGRLYDDTASYTLALWVALGMWLGGALIMLTTPRRTYSA